MSTCPGATSHGRGGLKTRLRVNVNRPFPCHVHAFLFPASFVHNEHIAIDLVGCLDESTQLLRSAIVVDKLLVCAIRIIPPPGVRATTESRAELNELDIIEVAELCLHDAGSANASDLMDEALRPLSANKTTKNVHRLRVRPSKTCMFSEC